MNSVSSPNPTSQKLVVKDPKGLLLICLAIVLFAFLTYYFLSTGSFLAALIIGIIPLGLLLMLFRAENEGYVIDPENDSFSYPGGKAADEITDYINPNWILQSFGFKRGCIQLSSITRISYEDITTRHWNEQFRAYQTIHQHNITLEGTFGSIMHSFGSRGKRDQLYSLLSQTLNMGEPVVVR